MTTQELLEALEKARNEPGLDQVAFWALSSYLHGTWKNYPARDLRAYDLGRALSDFFVDLSLHRLPERITNQTPQTGQHLLEFFGAAGGGLSEFWTRCIEIWDVTLKPYPAYAGEVREYFDLLLQSSREGKRDDPSITPYMPAIESIEETPKPPPQTPYLGITASEAPTGPLVLPESSGEETPFESAAPVDASFSNNEPEQAEIPETSGNQAGLVTAPLELAPDAEPESLPGNAYLVLQGSRVIPLNRPFIKIGRQKDNHIILEDPRVSRSHAQIKLDNGRFVIIDMNSTGGTFVNGRPTSRSVLFPDDEVSLAGVVFIFSQEMPARMGEMKIFELGSPFAVDRSTAVIHEDEMWAANKIRPKELPDLPKTGPFE